MFCRSFSDYSAFKNSRQPRESTKAVSVSGRFAHELLNYLPTYRTWLVKKPSRARRPRKSKGTVETLLSAQQRADLESQPAETLRDQERFPVDRPSPSVSEETMPPKIDLAAKLAEMTAKTKKAPSKRKEKTTAGKVVRISVPEDERPAKKPREDAQIPDETEKLSPGSEQTNIETPEIEVLTRPWSPKLVNAEGRSIMNTDSVRADSRLGLGLLPALALKNDMALVPSKIEDNLYHCSSLLVQVILQTRTLEFGM